MAVIHTILGDISPDDFGTCDFHEHLIRSYGPELELNAWYDMNSIPAACTEVEDWLAAGGTSMVCMDPLGCGRDVPKMTDIANRFRGKAHFVMTTGFHKGADYDNRAHWSLLYSHAQSVKLIADEVNVGMDLYSYAGPIVSRSPARAGIIKAGTSMRQITPFEQNAIWIDCDAQKECGAPISIHTDFGTMGPAVISLLKKNGANLEKCVLCHTNKINDLYYHERLLDNGINLCFEGPDRPEWATDSEVAHNIAELVRHGYQKQIVLSMDAGRVTFQKGYMAEKGCIANGVSYLLTDFIPQLQREGVSQEDIDLMLKKNPARILSIT